jgi:hypothetical protein
MYKDTVIGTINSTIYADVKDFPAKWTDTSLAIFDTAKILYDYSFNVFLREICDTVRIR